MPKKEGERRPSLDPIADNKRGEKPIIAERRKGGLSFPFVRVIRPTVFFFSFSSCEKWPAVKLGVCEKCNCRSYYKDLQDLCLHSFSPPFSISFWSGPRSTQQKKAKAPFFYLFSFLFLFVHSTAPPRLWVQKPPKTTRPPKEGGRRNQSLLERSKKCSTEKGGRRKPFLSHSFTGVEGLKEHAIPSCTNRSILGPEAPYRVDSHFLLILGRSN